MCQGGGVASSAGHVTFVGHSTVLIELSGVRLLTDPLLRPRAIHLRRHAAPPPPSDLLARMEGGLGSSERGSEAVAVQWAVVAPGLG